MAQGANCSRAVIRSSLKAPPAFDRIFITPALVSLTSWPFVHVLANASLVDVEILQRDRSQLVRRFADVVAGGVVAADDDGVATAGSAAAADLRGLAPDKLRVMTAARVPLVLGRIRVFVDLARPHLDSALGVHLLACRQILTVTRVGVQQPAFPGVAQMLGPFLRRTRDFVRPGDGRNGLPGTRVGRGPLHRGPDGVVRVDELSSIGRVARRSAIARSNNDDEGQQTDAAASRVVAK